MPARYRFQDRWSVDLAPEDVHDLLAEPLLYPDWWRSFCITARGDAGPPAVGKTSELLVKGFLPYRLTFTITATRLERPALLDSDLGGHLQGTATWTLERAPGGGTDGVLEMDVLLGKPLERRLSGLLRPLFAANHHWCMRRGAEEVDRYGPGVLHRLTSRGARPL